MNTQNSLKPHLDLQEIIRAKDTGDSINLAIQKRLCTKLQQDLLARQPSDLREILIDYLNTLLLQSMPYLQSIGFISDATHPNCSMLDTSRIFYENGKPLSQEKLNHIKKFNHDILTPFGKFAFYPPFKKGVFRTSKDLDIFYEMLDSPEHIFRYHIMPASRIRYKNRNFYQYIMNLVIEMEPPDDFDGAAKCTQLEKQLATDIYKDIDIQTCKWNQGDKDIFLRMLNITQKSNADNIFHIFLTHVMTANAILSKQKPISDNDQNSRHKHRSQNTVKIYLPTEDTAPNIIHKSMELHIRAKESVTTPEDMQKQDRLIHYQTPTWQVRGHVRHYKNGKTVYVKPSVHHRKKLDDNTDIKNKTIIFHK